MDGAHQAGPLDAWLLLCALCHAEPCHWPSHHICLMPCCMCHPMPCYPMPLFDPPALQHACTSSLTRNNPNPSGHCAGVAERLDAGAYLDQQPTRTADEASAWRRSGGPSSGNDV